MHKKIYSVALSAMMLFSIFNSNLVKVKATETARPVNLALNKPTEASEQETDYYGPNKLVDGIVNRNVGNRREQSRWATNLHQNGQPVWAIVDLQQETQFRTIVISWERNNIKTYKLQVSNDKSDWRDVFVRGGDKLITDMDENIRLDEAVTARYVRLYIDGYTGGTSNWRSVSVYELQIYADDMPTDILPTSSVLTDGTVEVSDFEPTPGNTQNGDKVIDGNLQTRWATNASSNMEARTLTITLPSARRIEEFKIYWERLNIDGYKLYTAETSNAEFELLVDKNTPITKKKETIRLDSPKWVKKVKIVVDRYNGGTLSWPNVSIAEIQAFAARTPEANANSTAKEIANLLEETELNTDNTAIVIPTVGENVTVKLQADYEQIVNEDGTFYKPLTAKTVKIIYKVEKPGDQAEGMSEFPLVIPGLYPNAGTNPKPTVIPELQEWYGHSGNFTINGETKLYSTDFTGAVEEFKNDVKLQFDLDLAVENTSSNVIKFEQDNGVHHLGKEGYYMEIGGDSIVVKSDDAIGAYYATRTLIQIMMNNQNQIPQGLVRDYPKYAVRGFSLDVGRKPISLEMLRMMAKEMAFYKMNDFQVHLNDNLIFYEDFATVEEAIERAYKGFRLESDIRKGGVVEGDSQNVTNKKDLTSEDLYYSKADFRDFIVTSRAMGVNIIPEFDAPGHAGSMLAVRPDLHLKQNTEGNGKRRGEQFDLSPAHYNDSVNFVKQLWSEFQKEDMFDSSMVVHIGTDEYYGSNEAFRKFSDDIIAHVQQKNPIVRMWGSLTHKRGTTPVRSENVQVNMWHVPYAFADDTYNQGFGLINTLENLYIVPSAGYYNNYLNPQWLYNNWQVNDINSSHPHGLLLPAGSKQMLGSVYAIWNDAIDTRANGISEMDVYDRFSKPLSAAASKNWTDPSLRFNQFNANKTNLANNIKLFNPYYRALNATNEERYLKYKFEDQRTLKHDYSHNGRRLLDTENVEVVENQLKLKGDSSYVTTEINKLAVGSTLEFDLTLTEDNQNGKILFEADHEGNERMSHNIAIMRDGNLGFNRELYEYSFNYKPPVNQKVHLAITTAGNNTYLTVNGQRYDAVGSYYGEDGTLRKNNITVSQPYKIATFLLPLKRIGSQTNAAKALIDNVTVYTGVVRDLSSLTDVEPSDTDTSALEELIHQVESLNLETYTRESVETLNTELTKAKELLVKNTVTAEEIEAEITALTNAKEALQIKEEQPTNEEEVDIRELNALISQIENLNPSDYQEESFNALLKAKEEAKKLKDSADITTEKVNQMVAKLNRLIGELQAVEVELTDKEKLQALVTAMENIEAETYTEESLAPLMEAKEEAKTLLEQQDPSDEDIRAMVEKITDLTSKLVEKTEPNEEISVAALDHVISTLTNLDFENIYDESARELVNQLVEKAEEIKANPSSQANVNNMVKLVEAQIGKLPKKLVTLTADEVNNVSVSLTNEFKLNNNITKFKVEEINGNNLTTFKAANPISDVYDMKLVDENDVEVTNYNNFKAKVRIPKRQDKVLVKVVYVDDNQNTHDLAYEIKDGMIEFEVSHFSVYSAVYKDKSTGAIVVDKTKNYPNIPTIETDVSTNANKESATKTIGSTKSAVNTAVNQGGFISLGYLVGLAFLVLYRRK